MVFIPASLQVAMSVTRLAGKPDAEMSDARTSGASWLRKSKIVRYQDASLWGVAMLDDRDRKILSLLQADAETPVSEIAESVALSPSACSRSARRR